MNSSRIDPLGVSGKSCSTGSSSGAGSFIGDPTQMDRWLLGQLTSGLDDSKVRMVLWDEPVRANRNMLPVTVCIGDRGGLFQMLRDPALYFGDLYSSGRITLDGDLLVLLDEAYRFLDKLPKTSRWLERTRVRKPGLSDSRNNIHHHYDLGNDFYKIWLDREAMQYTCAYYAQSSMTLEQAQQAKMHHVCRKLQLEAGDRVIEAGGGWGGFALFMAQNYGVHVRSFNISKEQITFSREQAQARDLGHLVEFIEDDYRNISGRCDVFVSIGMLEHVGTPNYRQLGELIARVLTPEGRGLVHTIGRDRPMPLNAWIARRIFPGAYPPTLREMMDIFEPNSLSVLDVENLRPHYALTLKHWLERFEQHADVVRAMFDESFVRAWRLYLAGSIMGFLHGDLQLFQVLFARTGANGIPWTRDHIYPPRD